MSIENIFSNKIYKDVNDIIEKSKSPFFLYDIDSLKKKLRDVTEINPSFLKLWYACKANPISSILNAVIDSDIGIDVASKGELHQVLKSTTDGSKIICTGPAKSKEYIEMLIERGIELIVVESLNQLLWVNESCEALKKKQKILLRTQLSLDYEDTLLGGSSITPFGVDPNGWKTLNMDEYENIQIMGFHVFQWTNVSNLEQLHALWVHSIDLLIELSKELNIKLEIIDLGGGLGIPYSNNEEEYTYEEVINLLNEIKSKYDIPTFWLELGRYIAGPFGYYFTKVVDKKMIRGEDLLITEGGINHISRPAFTEQSFPCKTVKNYHTSKLTTFRVHGPLCTALDYLGEFELASDIRVGDWLVFTQAGAYGFTNSIPYFLCHDLAAEYSILNNEIAQNRQTKTADEWLV